MQRANGRDGVTEARHQREGREGDGGRFNRKPIRDGTEARREKTRRQASKATRGIPSI
jgi:hypothetical protein